MDADVNKSETKVFYLRIVGSSDQRDSNVSSLLEDAASQIEVYEHRYCVHLLGVRCNVGAGVTHPFVEFRFFDWDHRADFGLAPATLNEAVNESNHPLFGVHFKPQKAVGDQSTLRLVQVGPNMQRPYSVAELFRKTARVVRELGPAEIVALVVVQKKEEGDMDSDVYGIHIFYQGVSASGD